MQNKKASTWGIIALVVLILGMLSIAGIVIYAYYNPNLGPAQAIIAPFEYQSFFDGQLSEKISGFFGQGFFSQQSVQVSCSPDSGFDKCWAYKNTEDSGGDAVANAYAEVQITSVPIGNKKGNYYLGEVYILYQFKGDKFYVAENTGSWDNLWSQAGCNENGCSGEQLDDFGRYYLAKKKGDSYTDCPIFYVWDYDRVDESDGSWAWTWTTSGYGWASNGNCFDIKVVECVDSDDCRSGKICDNSGSWNQWKCIDEPKETYYRYYEDTNECSVINIPEDEKTELDFSTMEECELNIKADYSSIIVQVVIGIGIFILIVVIVFIILKRRR